jgi:hypothetical protein
MGLVVALLVRQLQQWRRIVGLCFDVQQRETGKSGEIGVNGWKLCARAAKRVAIRKI